MIYQIDIQLKKDEIGYTLYCPDLSEDTIQNESLDSLLENFKEMLETKLENQHRMLSNKHNQPIWELAQDLTKDLTEEELNQLPQDGATEHDHYIYGTPKINS